MFAVAGCAAPRGETGPPAPQAVPSAHAATPASPSSGPAAGETPSSQPFPVWLAQLRTDALAQGISAAVFDRAMAGVQPNQKLLDLQRVQPEFVRPVWDYLATAVSPRRIAQGQRLLAENRALLDRVQARYGVDPSYIVAIWGLESDYGNNPGHYSVIESLATLAWGGTRPDAFRAYLIDALWILQEGNVPPARMVGSWAGAMGQTQFMPAAFRTYAVDFDGDGRRDIWDDLPDVFASTAHYLQAKGWQPGQACYEEVRLPPDFPWEVADLDQRKSIAEWQAMGVQPAAGRESNPASLQASLLLLAGHKGPAFLAFDNFRTIMRYNSSTSYALAICHLADRLRGGGPIMAAWPIADRPLSRSERFELQRLLANHHYLDGAVDGMIGPVTRTAIRRFQKQAGLPADGYPTVELLDRLRTWPAG
jgi:membrane-bound lytic murein transglycosylase B